MNGGLQQRGRILRHVDDHYRAGLEGFNRASHGDALREMQLGPAEDMQADDPPIGDPIGLIRSIGWRRWAAAALFALTVWIAAATFAVMCGGDPVSTQQED
ncbi:hypothetical protein [Sphingopyxis sp. SCN 67-31]|uniref:hypothetical protein n=1 Tax=Sphingopyxis sp. SCN 67-31 TaxID=1660142 RepID=UPI00086BFD44|nr:hypothetical protein [Sphingopyxis sp. SCN 67-31]ODU29010.1 MAG: hypothetical protein ABS88_10795 [Sphingopyxis sp. SCN 67-31]